MMKQPKAIALLATLLLLGCQVPTTKSTGKKPTTDLGGLVSQGGGGIIAQGGGNIVAQGGGNLTSKAADHIVAQGGGNLTAADVGSVSAQAAGLISQDGGSIVAQGGGNLISQDGGTFTGVAALPAGLISQDGAGLISQDGGSIVAQGGGNIVAQGGGNIVAQGGGNYRLAALAASRPIRQQPVYLMNAEGKLVLGTDGQPLSAMTDKDGHFAFSGFTATQNLKLAIKLYDNKGFATAILPRGGAGRTINIDLPSTLTAEYIQQKYLAKATDPVATLNRLPADLEAATRKALGAAATTAPADLTATAVVGLVDGLKSDATVGRRLVEVDRVLGAGLSDGGAGQPADSLETDIDSIAAGPTGQLAFASHFALRVYRKDPQGKLQVLAGNGFGAPLSDLAPTAAAPGDGGPAVSAPIQPSGLAYDTDGKLLIADNFTRRIRQVDAAGVITTRVADADWGELRGLVVEPDGNLLVATHAGVWRVPTGGQPTLLTGEVRAYDPNDNPTGVPAFGTTPASGRFLNIQTIARDPSSDAVAVFDTSGSVFRFDATTFARVAGTGTPGYSGDGGPATAAQLGGIGGACYTDDGKLVIADALNQRMRLVSDGTITTIAGTGVRGRGGDGGPATKATLSVPTIPQRAADGSFYFVDDGFVRKLADGKLATVVGGTRGLDQSRAPTDVQLLEPQNIVYDAASNALWIPDVHHIWRWSLDANTMTSVFGGTPTGQAFREGETATTSTMTPVSFLPQSPDTWLLLAADLVDLGALGKLPLGRIVQVKGGSTTTLAGGPSVPTNADLDAPAVGATFAAYSDRIVSVGDWIYYSERLNGHIRRFKPGGTTEAFGGYGKQTGDGVLAKDYNFYRLADMVLGPDNQLYVGTDSYIYRIDPDTAKVTYLAGSAQGQAGDGHPAKQSLLNYPAAFAWDAAGNLYFCEDGSSLVRRIRQDTGVIERVAGKGTANLAGDTIDTGLGQPSGLAFDKNGTLYVSDYRYGQIKKIEKARLAP